MTRLLLAALCGLFVFQIPAIARWKAQYASSSPEVRAWYERQQTTPEWRKRVGKDWYISCCDHSDVVQAEFGKKDGHWYYRTVDDGDWHILPDDVVQPEVMTPGSKSIMFVDSTGLNLGPVCFFPGGTGT